MTDQTQAVVLVVDDEPDVADAYATHIREQDRYEVRTAYSGETAMEALDESVDVVLLDRRMPGLPGDEVLERLRERGLDCRVAMVTAIDADFDIIDMPFDDYVVKPVTRTDLLGTIDRLMQFAEYERTLREYYRVSRKYATLSATKSESELAESEEFERLQRRRESLRDDLTDTVADLGGDDFEALFREFEDGPPIE
jgi:DNA-binding response OmpR family regulator